jgi:hypothetical protein
MPLHRRMLVDDARRGAFHLISRCVRRAYLCGDAAEHRRGCVIRSGRSPENGRLSMIRYLAMNVVPRSWRSRIGMVRMQAI